MDVITPIHREDFFSVEEAARTSNLHEAYIRQLCRKGRLSTVREGKNWLVRKDSLSAFLAKQHDVKATRREQLAEKRSNEYKKLNSGGTGPISIEEAAKELGIEEAYARQLCRNGKVIAERIGGNWCVNRESLASLLVTQSYQQAVRREELAHLRTSEYERSAGHSKSASASLRRDVAARIAEGISGPLTLLSVRFALLSITLLFLIGSFIAAHSFGKFAESENIENVSGNILEDTKLQLAAVASDPTLFFEAVSRMARGWATAVDSYLYSIAFPRPLTTSGAVVAKVSVRAPSPPRFSFPQSSQPPTVSTNPTSSNVTINQPVIERVIERQLLASQGGITEEILNARIEALDTALSNKIYSLTSVNTTVINNTYETLGAIARGDNFDDINIDDSDITDSRIEGGTITGLTSPLPIGSGGTGTSTAPSYGNVLLGNSAGGYDLVATSSLGITGGGGTIDGSGTANVLAYWTDSDTLAATSSPTADYFVATSSVASQFPYASTTALTVSGTASTTNLIVSALGSAAGNCLTTDSTGVITSQSCGSGTFPFTPTTFGSTLANATSTLIGFTQGIYSLASTTIGNGTQGGGLTIWGQATTTNLLVTSSTTLQNLTFLNATGTAATTTNLAITSVASGSLLKTTTGGAVVAAVAGTDYVAVSSFFDYPFPNDATTTILTFTNGLLSASTTINGNLVVTGNSTTTNATSTSLAVSATASTTNLVVSSVPSSLLKTDGTGLVTAAVAGSDYATPSQITSAYPFTTTTHFGTTTSATNTPLFLRGNQFSLFASSTSVFDRASTTQLTIGTDFISDFSSGLAISATGVVTVDDVTAVMLASGDFGDFSCNGTTCSFDADTVGDDEIDYTNVTLADFSNDADYVKWANATSSLWQSTGLLSTASSTIGNNTQTGGLTISGGATTTGNAYFGGNVGIGTTSPGSIFSIQSIANFRSGTSTIYDNLNVQGQLKVGSDSIFLNGSATSTFAKGIDIAGGCFAINGTCVGGSSEGTIAAAVFSTSTPGDNVSVVFTGAVDSSPSFSAGVLTLPSNTAYYTVEIWGGGGGGGGAGGGSSDSDATGAGGGGYSRKLVNDTTQRYYTVGAGGAGNTGTAAGATGGTSCFGNNSTACTTPILTATGGEGGGADNATEGGNGGTASGGDINSPGHDGEGANNGIGDAGGSGGFGGPGGASTADAGGPTGHDGTAPGGGGGGGDFSNGDGGDGGSGGLVMYVYTSGTALASGTVNSGTAGQVAYYESAGDAISATSSIFISSTGLFGIGTTSPYAKLSVDGRGVFNQDISADYFTATSTLNDNTFARFLSTFGTTTNATSTTLSVSSIASTTALIVSGAGGTAGCATFSATGLISNTGSACGSGDSSYPFALAGNATSTLTQFNGGLTAFASSTIGAGGQATGLTIFGGATTTGNAYFASNVGIGTTSPAQLLHISSNSPSGTTTLRIDNHAANGNSAIEFWEPQFGPTLSALTLGYDGTRNALDFASPLSGTIPFTVLRTGNIGIGTTTPWGLLSVNPNGISGPAFVIGSSTATKFIVDNAGNVGIGTTTPGSLFSIQGIANFRSGTSTIYDNLNVQGQLKVGTDSIFLNGSATSTFTHGINLATTGGCVAVNGTCIQSGAEGEIAAFVYSTSTPGSNVSVVFTGAVDSSPSFSAGTLTLPSNTIYYTAEIWGAGGGGGGRNSADTTGGAGGGGGGYSRKLFTDKTAYFYTLGTGGAGTNAANTDGGTGDASCYGTNSTACTTPTLTANGGGGGESGGGGGNDGGDGGTATGGDANAKGENGGGQSGGVGGTGGAAGMKGSNAAATIAGTAPGGGGGGKTAPGSASGAGGSGGLVIYVYTTGTALASGSVESGTAGQVAYYESAGDTVSATSSIFISPTGLFGIGTSSPYAKLSVDGRGVFNQDVSADYFTATSTTIASQLPYASTTMLTASNGLIASASSTIGDGSVTGGLTVSGNATTTGNLVVSGGVAYVGSGAGTWRVDFGSSRANVGVSSNFAILQAGSARGITFNVNNSSFSEGNGVAARILTTGEFGIGTTTPYAKLSVDGRGVFNQDVSADYFTATSTSVDNTFPRYTSSFGTTTNATSTTLSVSSTASTTALIVSGAGGTAGCAQFSATGLISNTGSACGTGSGGDDPFTHTTFGATNVSATTTALQLTGGLFASSTVRFGNAGISEFFYDGSVGNVGIGTTSPWALLAVNPTSALGSAPSFVIGSSTATRFIVDNAGNVGIGTTTPSGKFTVVPTANAGEFIRFYNDDSDGGTEYIDFNNDNFDTELTFTDDGLSYSLGIDDTDDLFKLSRSVDLETDTVLTINSSNQIGIGTSTPYSKLTVWGSDTSASTLAFQITNNASTTLLAVNNSGQVGIGTATPATPLHIVADSSDFVMRLEENSGGEYMSIKIDSSGDFNILDDGGGTTFAILDAGSNNVGVNDASPDAQFEVSLSGGTSVDILKLSSADEGDGDLLTVTAAGRMGIGTTTPNSILHVASTTPKFTLSDTSAGANLKHWFLQSTGGTFRFATTSDVLVDTVSSPFSIASTGFGTTTLSGLTVSGSATSTSNVGLDITSGCYAINGTCVGSSEGTVAAYIFSTTTSGSNVSVVFTGAVDSAPSLSAGVLTLPSNTSHYIVELWGAGGGGGGADAGQDGGGGGAGGYSSETFNDTTAMFYTIGSGGAGNTGTGTGTTGGTTCYGTNSTACTTPSLQATGGTGGGGGGTGSGAGGPGGVGTGGNINFSGNDGGTEDDTDPGYGGDSPRGGAGGQGGTNTGSINGSTGSSPGGGGGGGAISGGDGGTGAAGGLIMYVYTSGTALASGTVNSGTAGQVAYYESAGDTISATSSLFITTSSNVGVGTSTPDVKLQVAKDSTYTSGLTAGFAVTHSTSPLLRVELGYDSAIDAGYIQSNNRGVGYKNLLLNPNSGNVGIGTTSPYAKLSIEGAAVAQYFHATGSTASIFDGGFTAYASSTIGSGLQAAGLTISGGATTTGNAYFAGRVGIGTTSPARPLHVVGDDFVRFDRRSATFGAAVLLVRDDGGPQSSWLFGQPNVSDVSGDDFAIVDYGTAISGTSGTTRLVIDKTAGNVGVGTSSPWAKLSINNSTNDTAGQPLFVVASSTATATTTAFIITNSGNVGIGEVSPAARLEVKDDGTFTSEEFLLSLTYSGSGGDRSMIVRSPTTDDVNAPFHISTSNALNFRIDAVDVLTMDSAGIVGILNTAPSVALDVIGSIEYTGTITDVSDERLKENILSLGNNLEKLRHLNPVSFNMIGASSTQLGFLAQNVQEFFPDAVSVVDPEHGYLGLDYTQLIAPAIGAIQELNLNLETLASTTASTTPQSASFADSFFSNLFARITTWFADAGNGIADFFAEEIHAKNLYAEKLCLTDESGMTCITKGQLDALLAGAAISVGNQVNDPATSTPETAEETEPPSNEEIPIEEPPVEDTASSTPNELPPAEESPPEQVSEEPVEAVEVPEETTPAPVSEPAAEPIPEPAPEPTPEPEETPQEEPSPPAPEVAGGSAE